MNKNEFIEFVAKIAVKDWQDRRIVLPSITIAQACKESAFGTSELALNANALFGIKLNGWTGKSYRKKADEQNPDGTMRTDENALWRSYDNWEQSILNHSIYLAERKIGNQKEANFKAVIGETNLKKAIAALVGNYNRNEIAERCTDAELKQYVKIGTTQYGYMTGLNYPQSLLDDYIRKYGLTKYDKVVEEMGYTNSSLISYTKLSPNNSGNRTHSIDRISPHCVVGQVSVESLGNMFANPSRKASSNYGIGEDGRVGMYVEEKNRSWCTSSNDNDQRAVTIECASDATAPYAFNDVVYNKLIELCVDICKRNGKSKLIWINDKSKALSYEPKSDEMLITVHRWFANKSCPGDWLHSRLGNVADEVTKRLSSGNSSNEENSNSSSKKVLYKVQCGAFSKRENAEALQKRLKSSGFDSFIVEV